MATELSPVGKSPKMEISDELRELLKRELSPKEIVIELYNKDDSEGILDFISLTVEQIVATKRHKKISDAYMNLDELLGKFKQKQNDRFSIEVFNRSPHVESSAATKEPTMNARAKTNTIKGLLDSYSKSQDLTMPCYSFKFKASDLDWPESQSTAEDVDSDSQSEHGEKIDCDEDTLPDSDLHTDVASFLSFDDQGIDISFQEEEDLEDFALSINEDENEDLFDEQESEKMNKIPESDSDEGSCCENVRKCWALKANMRLANKNIFEIMNVAMASKEHHNNIEEDESNNKLANKSESDENVECVKIDDDQNTVSKDVSKLISAEYNLTENDVSDIEDLVVDLNEESIDMLPRTTSSKSENSERSKHVSELNSSDISFKSGELENNILKISSSDNSITDTKSSSFDPVDDFWSTVHISPDISYMDDESFHRRYGGTKQTLECIQDDDESSSETCSPTQSNNNEKESQQSSEPMLPIDDFWGSARDSPDWEKRKVTLSQHQGHSSTDSIHSPEVGQANINENELANTANDVSSGSNSSDILWSVDNYWCHDDGVANNEEIHSKAESSYSFNEEISSNYENKLNEEDKLKIHIPLAQYSENPELQSSSLSSPFEAVDDFWGVEETSNSFMTEDSFKKEEVNQCFKEPSVGDRLSEKDLSTENSATFHSIDDFWGGGERLSDKDITNSLIENVNNSNSSRNSNSVEPCNKSNEIEETASENMSEEKVNCESTKVETFWFDDEVNIENKDTMHVNCQQDYKENNNERSNNDNEEMTSSEEKHWYDEVFNQVNKEKTQNNETITETTENHNGDTSDIEDNFCFDDHILEDNQLDKNEYTIEFTFKINRTASIVDEKLWFDDDLDQDNKNETDAAENFQFEDVKLENEVVLQNVDCTKDSEENKIKNIGNDYNESSENGESFCFEDDIEPENRNVINNVSCNKDNENDKGNIENEKNQTSAIEEKFWFDEEIKLENKELIRNTDFEKDINEEESNMEISIEENNEEDLKESLISDKNNNCHFSKNLENGEISDNNNDISEPVSPKIILDFDFTGDDCCSSECDDKYNDKAYLKLYNDDSWDPVLLWFRPLRCCLNELVTEITSNNINDITSVGCGSGLLEWLIRKETGINVTGYEVNKSWWISGYSPPVFIPHVYVDEVSITFHSIPKTHALLFCYFNNEKVFKDYLKRYRGPLLIIIGPINGMIHTNPLPLDLIDSPHWILKTIHQQQCGNVIAFYVRR